MERLQLSRCARDEGNMPTLGEPLELRGGNTSMRDAFLRGRFRAVGNEEQAMKVSQIFALGFLSIASAAALAQQPGESASRLGREDKDASSMKVTTPEF